MDQKVIVKLWHLVTLLNPSIILKLMPRQQVCEISFFTEATTIIYFNHYIMWGRGSFLHLDERIRVSLNLANQ